MNILFFRSEEAIEGWCQRSGVPRGEALTLRKTWELSKAWYDNRLSPSFKGRTAEEAATILGHLGLGDGFWWP